MEWRFLVDEDTDADTASELEVHGHNASTISETIGDGSSDPAVAHHANDTNRILLTTDRDFLDADRYPDLQVFLVTDSEAQAHEIANKIDELT